MATICVNSPGNSQCLPPKIARRKLHRRIDAALTVARNVAEPLRKQPGFHAYTLVRTADDEVVAITLVEIPAQLHCAVESVSGLTQSNIHRLSSGKPEARDGEVIYHELVSG